MGASNSNPGGLADIKIEEQESGESGASEFSRFAELTEKLLTVPKEEVAAEKGEPQK
jgi:hypothetical protein